MDTADRKVIKRDGREVAFDISKVYCAIDAAFKSCGESYKITTPDTNLIAVVENTLDILYSKTSDNKVGVEDIQDAVEKSLMCCGHYNAVKAFILYRDLHKRLREDNETLIKEVAKKLRAEEVKNQNANVDEYSFGGRIGEASRTVTKTYALNHCMSKMAKNNHLNNRIYIHDLDSYAVGMHNCLSIPFDELLANGFNTRQTDVRPANSINTAFQLVAVIFQLQSLQQFGGVSATHLDWTMVPYVRKSFRKHWLDGLQYVEEVSPEEYGQAVEDTENTTGLSIQSSVYLSHAKATEYAIDMTKRELKQAVEGMYHNLNTLQSRSGNQLPFTSINYGTCMLIEGQMVIEALLDGSINGVGKHHKTPIFPCGIFQFMKGVNDREGTPNYYLFKKALESTSKRLYPNYANCDWSGNAGFDVNNPQTYFSTMGCRTANGWDINGFGQQKDGRGNICPVTLILPTIAMEAISSIHPDDNNATERVGVFLHYLENKIEEAKDMLLERFEWICSQSSEAAKFMYENHTMAGYIPEEGIRSALKHGTLAIGQIALAETLQLLIGKDHTTEEGMKVAKQIEQLFKTKCTEYKEKYKLNFGVYYTPAENLCYTAMQNFKKKYGVIPNVSDREYFTNSIHVPVWANVNPFEKIDIEAQLTGYSSAGCITYVELPSSAKHNIDALEALVTYAMDKDIPYFAINVPNDTCENCGYTDEIGDTCPQCGSHNIKRLRRVTGYLTGDYITAFNKGKQVEVKDRVKHSDHEIC